MGGMEMLFVDVPVIKQPRNRPLDLMSDDLGDVRSEIVSLLGQLDTLREDIYGGSTARSIRWVCCCCRRRDLRRLEDRLWLRLHQLQDKENEIHRQRTAILSRSLLNGAGSDRSPVSRKPPPVSPEAPESPPWPQHSPRREKRSPGDSKPIEEDDRLAPGGSQAAARIQPLVQVPPLQQQQYYPQQQQQQQQPLEERSLPLQGGPTHRLLNLRRRPSRPGSAEDITSGAE